MKILLISPKNRTVYNFKGDLIRELIAKGHRVTVTGPDETDLDKILDLGVTFVKTPVVKTGTNIFTDFNYLLSLIKIIKSIQPDMVLSYTVKPIVYGSLAARLNRVKSINSMVTGAGYAFTATTPKAKALHQLVKLLYRIGFGCSDRVLFLNKDDRQEFLEKKLLPDRKCFVIDGEGVNMTRFTPSGDYPEQLTFFMLARLLTTKGVLEYLQAAKQVKTSHPDTRFMLLGSYIQMPESIPKEQIEPYIVDGTIKRYDETSDVRAFYEQSSVYVLPSYREGVPRTNLEAMAMARPIITTDTNGCRETVVDGYNGFMVPVKDVPALVDKMLFFINHPHKVKEMGQNSQQLCREKFEVSKVNRDILSILNLA